MSIFVGWDIGGGVASKPWILAKIYTTYTLFMVLPSRSNSWCIEGFEGVGLSTIFPTSAITICLYGHMIGQLLN